MPGPYRNFFDPDNHSLIDKESGVSLDGQPGQYSGDDFVNRTAANKFTEARQMASGIEEAKEILQEEALEGNNIWIRNQIEKIKIKINSGYDLGKDDLSFIYNTEIYNTADHEDIKELRKSRDIKADVPVVLGCQPEEIAWDKKDINGKTKVYVGPLFRGVFDKNLSGIYTSFPEGAVYLQTITVDSKTSDEILDDFRAKGVVVSEALEFLIQAKYGHQWKIKENPAVLVENGREDEVDIVNLTVKDLGFTKNIGLEEICKRAKDLGLIMLSPQIALQYRLEYVDKQKDDALFVPVNEEIDGPNLFILYEKVISHPRIHCLRKDVALNTFSPDQKFAFQIPPAELSDEVVLDSPLTP